MSRKTLDTPNEQLNSFFVCANKAINNYIYI